MKAGLRAVALILTLWGVTLPLSCHAESPIQWYNSLDSARQAAAGSGRNIVVFFYASTGDASSHLAKLLEDSSVIDVLSGNYEAFRLDINAGQELATRMGVFKGGVLLVYDSKGHPLDQIKGTATREELLTTLRHRAGLPDPPASGLSPQPASTQGSQAFLRGALITGPITVQSTLDKPVRVYELQKGRKYWLVVEGVCSLWRTQKDFGADALFRYQVPHKPGQLEAMDLVRFQNPDVSMYDLVRTATGSAPVCRSDHHYEAVVTGEGKPLSVFVSDRDYKDNSGAFKVTLYEAKAVTP